MTEMFGLLKELSASRTPEKVLTREEARYPITKNVNSISVIREEEEKDVVNNKAIIESIVEPNKSEEEEPPKKASVTNGVKRRVDDKPTKSVRDNITKNKEEEAAGASSSHTIGYYLKHRINEKLIEGLMDNQKLNDSLLGVRARKIKGKTYNLSPKGPVYEAILKKKITKKEDIGRNFEIPSKDVLVDVAGYAYPVDSVILDIKEDEKRPFILGTPFLTTAKAVIKFDKGTITLRFGKSKISFHRIPESLCKIEKGIKNDIELIALAMTVNRLVL
ncbi:CAAX amino terminal protease [Tanacetum coccineum]